MTTRAARLLAAFNRGVKRSRDAYNADQSVQQGCHLDLLEGLGA